MGLEQDGSVRWRCHLRSSPESVYALLDSAEGRVRFWAEQAAEQGDAIGFRFINGQELTSQILEREPPRVFRLTYFGGSRVTFSLSPDGAGGTELELLEEYLPPDGRSANLAGWVSVLLNLKAVADHGIDLRNHDARRSWDDGYIDT